MSNDQKRTSVAYALNLVIALIDALIDDIEAREGVQSPLAKQLKDIKNGV